MNTKLLRKIQKHILAEPRRLNMNFFGIAADPEECKLDKTAPPCGTVGCIAGTAAILGGLIKPRLLVAKIATDDGWKIGTVGKTDAIKGYLFSPSTFGKAKKILDLTKEQAQRLFYFPEWIDGETGWPRNFVTAYEKAKTPKTRAKVTCERIDHFIKTKGAE